MIFCNDPSIHTRTWGVNVRARVLSRQNARAHVFASCAYMCARIFMKNLWMILYYLMNRNLKFHKNRSFYCGDIRKTILTTTYQILMYFAYFYSFAPPKSSKMDYFWIIMEFFGNYISKWPNLMDKMTYLPGYRVLSSTSNMQILFNRTKWTHCSM